ncbi:molybdopterin molybdotransferase,K07219; putative molybdopterin biosynthesis protein [Thermoflexales bacterium]|nr:molybdopterin molybdotransferase,K07219; putative molybdopterin biosynthesis protein [Thermoflexales bacterium]
MTRKVYLEDIPLDEAWRRFSDALKAIGRWQPIEGEDVPVARALGRITARPIWAQVSSPAYHASAMDGYAVRAEETITANDTQPLQLELGSQAQYVDTGDPLPGWADAVIMIEQVQPSGTTHIEIRAPIAPWTAVRPLGEDMVATELVLPANHILRPVDLGALAGSGHALVNVRRKPRVAVIPTGTELITVEQAAQTGVKSGDIIEYNSIVLAAEVEHWGGVATRYPIVIDNFEAIKAAVAEAAARHDLILINAGSSAGSEDFTARVVQELGTLLVHGIAVRPGHPVILGMIEAAVSDQQSTISDQQSAISSRQSATPIVGVPGYPVSAALTGEIFVEPLLARWLGLPGHQKPTLRGHITRKLLSPLGEDEWVRVTTGKVGERIVAAPLSRGAGVITSLVRADGIVRIPRFSEGVATGAEVTIELYTDPAEIDRTIMHIGSHDLTLDLLAQHLAEMSSDSPTPDRSLQRRFVSAHAGSLGGLIALRRGEAHLAGSHLLDPESGEYNFSYIKQYLPDVPVVVVTLLRREQGLIVAKGNPQNIASLKDLARPEVRFVNRQRGAGTRVLLDYRLKELGIAAESVHGYRREEYTHLAVAAAVQSGVADCGLGVRAAARALDLDFVSVEWERYDLVIPRQFYESELLQPLLALIRGESFRKVVGELEGYDANGMGEVVRELGRLAA